MKGAPGSAVTSQAVPADAWLDGLRQPLTVGAEAACAVLRGIIGIRELQLQAGREALKQHVAAVQALRDSTRPEQMLAIGAGLLRFEVEHGSILCQQLAAALAELQSEVAESWTHGVPSDDFMEVLSAGSQLAMLLPHPPVPRQAGEHQPP